jgi:hypothetical protein
MKIERIESTGILTSILKLEDPGIEENVLDQLKITKAEWVQYLIQTIGFLDGNFMRIWGLVEDDKILGYMVATNCMAPPLYRSFMINYQAFFGLTDEDGIPFGLKAFEEVKAWARSFNSENIMIFVNNKLQERFYSRYGFKSTENICMISEL